MRSVCSFFRFCFSIVQVLFGELHRSGLDSWGDLCSVFSMYRCIHCRCSLNFCADVGGLEAVVFFEALFTESFCSENYTFSLPWETEAMIVQESSFFGQDRNMTHDTTGGSPV